MSYSIDLSGRVALVTGPRAAWAAVRQRWPRPAPRCRAWPAAASAALKTLRAEIEAGGGDAHVVALDVTDHASIKAAVAHAETEMGTIDILVNNSGVSTAAPDRRHAEDGLRLRDEHQHEGRFFVAQEVGKRMLARAQGAARLAPSPAGASSTSPRWPACA